MRLALWSLWSPVLLLAACGSSPRVDQSLPVDGGWVAADAPSLSPVVATAAARTVRVGLAADRASWAFVHHWLERGEWPPAGLVRVEDCVDAMAPPPPRSGTGPATLSVSLAPSPFRPGWHDLVVGIAAAEGAPAAARVIVDDAADPLARALVALDAPLVVGDARALRQLLAGPPGPLVWITDGAGLGGVDAQQPLLDALVDHHRRGGYLIVAARLGPGMDDALLDRAAQVGGGLHEVALPGVERQQAASLARGPGLSDAIAEVRFDPEVVSAWRLVGRDARGSTDGRRVAGGLVPGGDGIYIVFELRLTGAASGPLGELELEATGVSLSWPLTPAPLASHRAVVAVAAFAEKLRRSPWADAITWPSLEAAIAAVASPAFRDEVGGLVTRARALASDEGR